MKPLLSVVMATYDDFDGVYFTIGAIRELFPDLLPTMQFVVVDNNPGTQHSTLVRGYMANVAASCLSAKYVEMPSPKGTTPSRARAMAEADGVYVLVCDCHILLKKDSLYKLVEFFHERPQFDGIVHGPLMYDNRAGYATHFDDRWREEMRGTWGSAWLCPCETTGAVPVSVNDGPDGQCRYRLLKIGEHFVDRCPGCGQEFPKIGHGGHERELIKRGYIQPHLVPDAEPFDIPGQGLGLFAYVNGTCMGFVEHASGFGAEELCFHDQYHNAGRPVVCLPSLCWSHRFARAGGTPYSVPLWDKMRNYVLWYKRNGMDPEPIHQHFVTERKRITEAAWRQLVADPVATTVPPCEGCQTTSVGPFATVAELLQRYASIPRDLNEHLADLAYLATSSEVVVEITHRKESSVAFMAGGCRKLVSFSSEVTPDISTASNLFIQTEGNEYTHTTFRRPFANDIPPCDLLFINGTSQGDELLNWLERAADVVRGRIAIHDTVAFGINGTDGKPGLSQALHTFLNARRDWFVWVHTDRQAGMTILSRLDSDKIPLPPMTEQAKNFFNAALTTITGVLSGAEVAAEHALTVKRLEVCSVCPNRNGERCAGCGCFIRAKASVANQACPLGLWPGQDRESPNGMVVREMPRNLIPWRA